MPTMDELIESRIKQLRLVLVRKLHPLDVAEAMNVTVEEVEDLCSSFKQYYGEPKLPRNRAKRDEAVNEPATRVTRARTPAPVSEPESSGSGMPESAVAQRAPGI